MGMNIKEGFGQTLCYACGTGTCAGAAANGDCSFAAGESADALGDLSIAIGYKNLAGGQLSVALGPLTETTITTSQNMTLGMGIPGSNILLSNNISNSLMLGMNSNLPTVFLEDGGGSGHWGRVGIGTTSPQGLLHLRDESGSNTEFIIDRNGTAQANLLFNTGGTTPLARIGVNGSGSSHLHYDLFQSGASHIFYVNSSNEAMRIVGNTGNVCIGTQSASGRLHVNHATANTDVIIQRNGANEGRLRFHSASTAASNLSLTSANDFLMQGLTTNRHLLFNVNMGGTDTEVMRVDGSTSNVGIGTTAPAAKLDVITTAEFIAQFFFNDNAAGSTRPRLQVRGSANRIDLRTAFNTGGADLVLGTTAATNAVHIRQNGNVGIGTSTPSGRLHVNGTVFVNNTPNGVPSTDTQLGVDLTTRQVVDLGVSNINFKEQIEDIQFDREAFLNLRPVDFRWKESSGGGLDVGLIAQEVAETFPALALYGYKRTYSDNGEMLLDSSDVPVEDTTQLEVRGVRYHKLPVYLLALAQDQQNEITELRQQIEELSNVVNGCCTGQPMPRLSNGNETEQVVKSNEDKLLDEFVLLHNDPNPFSDYSDITYRTSDCNRCQIIITDMGGRVIKRIAIHQNEGTVRVYSSEIGSGMFTYSIVEGTQVIASSKMVSAR